MNTFFLFFFLLLVAVPCCSQLVPPLREEDGTDTSRTLDEVTLRAFEQNRRQSTTTFSVKQIESNNADRYNKTSLVHAFNTIAGVRMEERSPGSYRINIRGSSLRSPFGVRNVKVYWNDIPITDAGGNTYFNQFAYNNFSSIEIFKGPAGSMYGAGTGGLILMHTLSPWQPGVSAEYITGSYNLHNIFTSVRFGKNQNKNQLSFAHNQSDGYRLQSRMRRDNFSWTSKLIVSEQQQLSLAVLLTGMYYQTPGALTLTEFKNNPRSARPAAGALPSAVNAKAAIEQVNFLAGFNHFYKIKKGFTNHTTFYGSFTTVNNPAIRNYERRNEPGFGGRSVFTYEKKKQNIDWQLVGGTEFQHGFFNTTVFRNLNGKPDTLQTNDDVIYSLNSFFIQGDAGINRIWFINGGLSLNRTRLNFARLSQVPLVTQNRSYRTELAPRISLKRMFTEDLSLKATVARGFSPPTMAELLPSTGVISLDLEAEYGWNYEMTLGYNLFKRKLRVEATGFYFKLNKALVQRRDSSGADFFVNAGNVKQQGIELHADYLHRPHSRSFIDYLDIRADYSYNHFRYGSFIRAGNDFSGKTVPSVPANTFSFLMDLQLKNGGYTNITWYTAAKIFLNDANTASAEAYHLLGWRVGWKKKLKRNSRSNNSRINFYAGVDNLLNEIYSLGNDINAPANRFYNAAPERNYYIGLSFQWTKTPKK